MMTDEEDETQADSPNAKRLTIPPLDLPTDRPPTLEELSKAACSSLIYIAQAFNFLKADARARTLQENSNAEQIRGMREVMKELVGEVKELRAETKELRLRVEILENPGHASSQ